MNSDSAVRWLGMSIATLLVAAVGSAGVMLSSREGSEPTENAITVVGAVATVPPTTTPPQTVPPTTVPPVTTAVPRPAPTTVVTAAPAPPPAAAPVGARSSAERCMETLAWSAAHGLRLPPGWQFRCPGPVTNDGSNRYWGRACMNLVGECPGTAYVAVDVDLIGPRDATLHYVTAHEICHAIEMHTTHATTEASADACAAAHGAPRA